MSRYSKPIQAEFVEFRCEEDGCRGVMRSTGKLIESSARSWEHNCSSCGRCYYIGAVFPLVRYADRDFGLVDKMRVGAEKPR